MLKKTEKILEYIYTQAVDILHLIVNNFLKVLYRNGFIHINKIKYINNNSIQNVPKLAFNNLPACSIHAKI